MDFDELKRTVNNKAIVLMNSISGHLLDTEETAELIRYSTTHEIHSERGEIVINYVKYYIFILIPLGDYIND